MIPSTRSLRLWPQFGSILPFDLNPRLSAVKPPIRELFIRGSLESGLDRARIAIIGSRSACSLASAWAEGTAARLATAGWVVVSGGARGIDAAAHRGALKAAGPTWWVSAPRSIVYPAEHRELLQRIWRLMGPSFEVPPGQWRTTRISPSQSYHRGFGGCTHRGCCGRAVGLAVDSFLRVRAGDPGFCSNDW